MYGTMNIKKTN